MNRLMKFLLTKVRRYPVTCLLVVAIWVVCLIPVPETPLSHVSFIDKWTHFVMYGTLTSAIWIEYAYRHDEDTYSFVRIFVGGFVLPIIMGGLIELAQAYLTTCRSGEVFDFVCNSMGVVLGMTVGFFKHVCFKK